MLKKSAMAAVSMAVLLSQSPVFAQEYFARHKLEVQQTPQGPSAAWESGTWGAWSSTCSDAAMRTRTVLCKKGAQLVEDTNCPMFDRPPTSDVQSVLTSCSYGWDARQGTWSQSCGAGSIRTTTYVCERSDSTVAADNLCSGTKPTPIIETRTSYDGCKAKDWALGEPVIVNACIAGQNETRSTVSCMINGAPAADTVCTGVVKPSGIGSTSCGPVTNNCGANNNYQQAMTSPDRIHVGTAMTGSRYLDRLSIAKDLCNRHPSPLKRCSGEVTIVGVELQVAVYGIPANAPNPSVGYSPNGYNMVMSCTQ